jgi:pyruvate ferredoxin oxidoreductase gamma subunit
MTEPGENRKINPYQDKNLLTLMIEIRIHGRGGQGVVTAAELLASAAFRDGKVAQAFPSFGSERMGAPVTAFCRISTNPIRSREPVAHPNVLLILDSTLLHQMDVFSGLSDQGIVLMNSTRKVEELGLKDWMLQHPEVELYSLPASDLAERHLGRPLANVGMVSCFASITGALSKGSVQYAIQEKFPGKLGELNAQVASEALYKNCEN